MQLDAVVHFREIILPTLSDYNAAESSLSRVINENCDDPTKAKPRYTALRLGGAAAIYLHHFADVVANRPLDGLPEFKGNVAEVRKWLAPTTSGRDELVLLKAVADSLKHATLTFGLPREVEHSSQVLVIDRAYGTARYGEGKLSGEQVWILAKSGKRPLTTVLKSVTRLWEAALSEILSGDA